MRIPTVRAARQHVRDPGDQPSIVHDDAICTWRRHIKNFFCKLEVERLAMRACKTNRSLEAMIYLAAVINSR